MRGIISDHEFASSRAELIGNLVAYACSCCPSAVCPFPVPVPVPFVIPSPAGVGTLLLSDFCLSSRSTATPSPPPRRGGALSDSPAVRLPLSSGGAAPTRDGSTIIPVRAPPPAPAPVPLPFAGRAPSGVPLLHPAAGTATNGVFTVGEMRIRE